MEFDDSKPTEADLKPDTSLKRGIDWDWEKHVFGSDESKPGKEKKHWEQHMDVISDLNKTNSRIVKYLRLYSQMDTPEKARKDLAEAEAGLAASTGERRGVHYTVNSEPTMTIILDGTDELLYLQRIMNAKTRVHAMQDGGPVEQITRLLRRKIELTDKLYQLSPETLDVD